MSKSEKMAEIAGKMKALLDEAKQAVSAEEAVKAKWEKKLAVQLKTGEAIAFCDDWTEVEEAMKADAAARHARVVAECRAKHVKIVVSEVPETDYVVQEVWHRIGDTVTADGEETSSED